MPSAGGEISEEIATIGSIIVLLFILIAATSPLFGLIATGGDTVLTKVGTNQFELSEADGESVSVSATTGQGAVFDGDDSISWTAPVNRTDGYALCANVVLSESANLNATYSVLGYENATATVTYSNYSWIGIIHDGNQSVKASLPATSPRDWTAVCLNYNADQELQLSRGTTTSSWISASNETEQRPWALPLRGSLDEIRAFNSTVNESQLNRYVTYPVASLPSSDRAARIMFDRTPVSVYYGVGTVSSDGAVIGNGRSGLSLSQGEDYRLTYNPLQLQVLSGGLIEDAPIIWVSWQGPFAGVINILVTALQMIAVVAVLLGAAFAYDKLESYNNGR